MTFVVAGVDGYIGSRVVRLLRNRHPEWSVTALNNFYLGDVREVAGVGVDHVDVRDRDRLEEAFACADVVVHLAAVSGVDDCEQQPGLGRVAAKELLTVYEPGRSRVTSSTLSAF